MRNQRIARVAVYPADYDAGARRLVLYHRIEVAVAVEPAGDLGPPAESPDPFEGVYQAAVLNYEQGQGWRRPATRRLLERAAVQPARLAAFAPAVPETSVYVGSLRGSRSRCRRPASTRWTTGGCGTCRCSPRTPRRRPLDSLRLFNWPGFPVLPDRLVLRFVRLPRGGPGLRGRRGRALRHQHRPVLLLRHGAERLGEPLRPGAARDGLHQPPVRDEQLLLPDARHRRTRRWAARPRASPRWTAPSRIRRCPRPATFPARSPLRAGRRVLAQRLAPVLEQRPGALLGEVVLAEPHARAARSGCRGPCPARTTTQPARLRALTWGLNQRPRTAASRTTVSTRASTASILPDAGVQRDAGAGLRHHAHQRCGPRGTSSRCGRADRRAMRIEWTVRAGLGRPLLPACLPARGRPARLRHAGRGQRRRHLPPRALHAGHSALRLRRHGRRPAGAGPSADPRTTR